MIPTDWVPPTSSVLSRLSDRRVQQYWDRDHVLARQMQRDARHPQPEPGCCERNGIIWDLAAVYPKGSTWTEQLPIAMVFNGPVADAADAIESAVATPNGGGVPTAGRH
jgi:hypothetical protein